MKKLGYIAAVALITTWSCKESAVESKPPINQNPVISSVTIFPQIVGPSDSLIVICTASDPDGDSLVYDWYSFSGSIVRIKGARIPGQIALYNTTENWQIFYAPDIRPMLDLSAILFHERPRYLHIQRGVG